MTDPSHEIWFLTSELEGQRASSFRQERWCLIFLDQGVKVRVLNLRGAFSLSSIACTDHLEFRDFRRRAIAAYSGPEGSVREGYAARLLRRIKHLFLIDLYLPNVLRMFFTAHLLLRRREDAVIVMASSPPFSVAVVGSALKVIHGKKMVFAVDMRDAWALHKALGGVKFIKRMIERSVLRRADHVSTVSHGLAAEFKQAYGVPVNVLYNVATHYLDMPPPDPIEWSSVSPKIEPQRMQLVYTGSTPEGHYDLKSVVRSIVQVRQERPDIADKFQLVFVGPCDEARREALRQSVNENDIVFVGHLPHKLSRSVQAKADALIFLAHFGENNAGVVSTKLFEYLCLGKRVLPLSLHEGSDVDRLLRRYCGKSLNVHSADEMARAITRTIENGCDWLPKLADVTRVLELTDDYREYAKRLVAR